MSKALILGSSGRYGRHCLEAFTRSSWTVQRFDRAKDSLNEAAANADVIINGWNPPYEKWGLEVPRLTKAVIEAAKINDALVIVPGNVYGFGESSEIAFDENSPHLAKNPLGRVRIEMESAYCAAGVNTIILRAGDFIDTQASGTWLDRVILAKRDKGMFEYPGPGDEAHSWAYLPDLASATLKLAEMRDQLDMFEDIPFPGFTLTGRELREVFNQAPNKPLRFKSFNWLPIVMAAPFWKTGRHLLEMRYLWSKPHGLDDTKFKQLLPEFEATSTLEVVKMVTKAIDVR